MDASAEAAAAAAEASTATTTGPVDGEEGLVTSVYVFFFGTPVNALLTTVCAWLLYRLLRPAAPASRDPADSFVMPPPLEKQDMTLDTLKQYDGRGADGRVLIAIMGKVFDCTRGRKFYGPGGPYCTFAGRDATRALATFDVHAVTDQYESYDDLTPGQKASVEEWQMQLSERYDLVGSLIRPEDALLTDDTSSNSNGTAAAATEAPDSTAASPTAAAAAADTSHTSDSKSD